MSIINKKFDLPHNVKLIIKRLRSLGFEAYIVGGAVRDFLMGNTPKDYDICTNALPNEIIKHFEQYTLIKAGIKHGTVGVVISGEVFEITTFRLDGEYGDNRRPNSVSFVSDLESDLKRRDFTINAMAYSDDTGLIDPFGGLCDLNKGIIRAVGNAEQRFNEDALRIIRAVRFAGVHGFTVCDETKTAIHKYCHLLKNIASERIRDELTKLLCGAAVGDALMEYGDVIAVFIPEITDMFGFEQNTPYHDYDVWAHSVIAVKLGINDLIIRLALLLHDIGKPACYTVDENGVGHFYGHAKISAEMAEIILKRLKFDNDSISKITQLIKYHSSDIIIEEKYIKRWLNKIGYEQFIKLTQVRLSDDLAKSENISKARISSYGKMAELADDIIKSGDCISLATLEINGNDLINMGIPQGSEIGRILSSLMEMILNGEIENKKDVLVQKARILL